MTSRKQERRLIPVGRPRRRSAIVGLAVALMAGVFAMPSAQAQSFTILHSFGGDNDGAAPFAGLFRSSAGDLYGTTALGGTDGLNVGTIFKLDTNGKEVTLFTFNPQTDEGHPYAGLIRDASSNFYGTTASGYGTVFKLSQGALTVLYSFAGGSNGSTPYAGLIRDSAGNLYGTTFSGGANNYGTVFKLDPGGTLTVLHAFGAGPDGRSPYGGLIRDGSGNFYGTTYRGGKSTHGTVFKLNPTNGKYAVLHHFGGAPDGAHPAAGLIRDSAGNLYGTTTNGGASNHGTVFKLSQGTLRVLYSFTGGSDGRTPFAGLVQDVAGNLYGTTRYGGMFSTCCGTVFELDTTSTLRLLHTFSGSPDGAYPYAGVILDSGGNLYGTTIKGGAGNQGTVFELSPQSRKIF